MVLSIKEEVARIAHRAKKLVGERGVRGTLAQGLDKALVYAAYPLHRFTKAKRSFSFQDKSYVYFCHHYNATWRNERAVEVALGLDFLKNKSGKKLLEVGNVMAYYSAPEHLVIDKYEQSKGVKNIDVMDLNEGDKFDAILAISTLEHVGWDETPREPSKILLAFEKLKAHLAPGGKMLLTVPLGYNEFFDNLVSAQKLPFENVSYLKRLNNKNDWYEATRDEVMGAKYNSPYLAANAIAVIQI